MERQHSAARSYLESMLSDESAESKALPLSLFEEITDGFSDDRVIGRGGFAVVYKGILKNGMVAVKRLSNTHMHEEKLHQEVDCLMKAKHKYVVRFLGYCADTQGIVESYDGKIVMADVQERLICFEYLPNGSLRDYINDVTREPEWGKCYRIINGICKGLHYLHRNRIIHLDLKPDNILLDYNMMPKITDFGLSRCFDEKQSSAIASKLIGTMGYFAPEFYGKRITFKSDIYSLGVIIIELLTGDKGYPDVDDVLEIWRNRLEKSQGDTQLEQVRVCTVIGMECIDTNPAKRPDIRGIIHRLDEIASTDGYTEIACSSVQQAEKVQINRAVPTQLDVLHPATEGPGSVVENFTLDVLHAATEGRACHGNDYHEQLQGRQGAAQQAKAHTEVQPTLHHLRLDELDELDHLRLDELDELDELDQVRRWAAGVRAAEWVRLVRSKTNRRETQ